MPRYRRHLPQFNDGLFLAWTGMETDLIFSQGVNLPGFAAYPLLESAEGRGRLAGYYRAQIALGRAQGVGVILESPTWLAHRDRGGEIGYAPDRLRDLNRQAIAQMAAIRDETGDLPTVLSANIGPRRDAYATEPDMTADEAEAYHAEQIAVLAATEVDVISGYTLGSVGEAIGIVRAARRLDLPVVIAFTVETDGRLPTGAPLGEAVAAVDAATAGYAEGFMVNCAHPEHVAPALSDAPWMARLRGIVANASRCSHAELDAAETLHAGDAHDLAAQLAALRARFPQFSVLGGCCGTDMRHMARIAEAARSA
jgi:homocysteine S-methyltransferase